MNMGAPSRTCPARELPLSRPTLAIGEERDAIRMSRRNRVEGWARSTLCMLWFVSHANAQNIDGFRVGDRIPPACDIVERTVEVKGTGPDRRLEVHIAAEERSDRWQLIPETFPLPIPVLTKRRYLT